MNASVREFVASCHTCQQAKPDGSRLSGLLQPLPVPDDAWKVISMDFVDGLPISGRFNAILVIMDLFSKYAHFVGLRHPFTAATVASLFMQQVYRLHGMPFAIVSDRDKIFTSKLWTELFKLCQVDLRMSTAYHPQSDGQRESINVLRRFCDAISMLVQPNGVTGFTLPSIGTIATFTPHWDALLLKRYTGMLRLILASLLLMLRSTLIWNLGSKSVS